MAAHGPESPPVLRIDQLTTLHASVMSGAIGDLPDDLMKVASERLKAWLEF